MSGRYTCSWSSGYAIGPFLAGFLWGHLGWSGCHLLNAAACVVIAVAIYVIHRHIHSTHPVDAPAGLIPDAVPVASEYAGKPDLAWMSWVFGGIGCIAVLMIRGLFASSGEEFAIPKFEQGIILGVLSGVQALVGLALGLGRWWMYRPLPILGFGLCGTAGMVVFALSKTTTGFIIAAVLFGIYSGSFFFYFVFHSLVHPERAAGYVSINEAVVGLTGIIGPLAGGLLADGFTLPTSYMAAAGLVLAGIVTQSMYHARLERRPPVLPNVNACPAVVPERVRQ